MLAKLQVLPRAGAYRTAGRDGQIPCHALAVDSGNPGLILPLDVQPGDAAMLRRDVLRAAPVALVGAAGPALASMLIYVLMAVILAWRPQGLFPANKAKS
jgi:hypothetical protein